MKTSSMTEKEMLNTLKWDQIIITHKNSNVENNEKYEYDLVVWWNGMNKSLILGYGDTIEKARDNAVENFY